MGNNFLVDFVADQMKDLNIYRSKKGKIKEEKKRGKASF
jgi:hypothetical protein